MNAQPPGRLAHGGDVAAAARRHGRPAGDWVDLSTGVNPWPYPLPDLAADAWTRLPQHDAAERLIAAARAAYGAGPEAGIVAAPGTQAILQWLPRLIGADAAGVITPTYGEHARLWQASVPLSALADLAAADAFAGGPGRRVVALGQPNNPDGRHWPPERLTGLAGTLAAGGGWLVVDEAFADVLPEASVAPAGGAEGLIVLRSFGKIFGLAGLRLGFALTTPAFAERLADALGPWAVAGPALQIGAAALADAAWLSAARRRLAAAAERLDHLLAEHRCRPLGGTALFRLAETPGAAAALADGLARHGILVRQFATAPRHLRFGLPGPEAHWRRLDGALGDAIRRLGQAGD